MSKNLKLSLIIASVFTVVVGTLFLLSRPDNAPAPSANGPVQGPVAGTSAERLIRPDSHKLSAPTSSKVTVVEFLDLECEACRAAFPGVEKLREEYGDRVTFVMRYFPVPAHKNAELAARSVEAAFKQDKLEAMYRKMYETQESWGDQRVDHRNTFLGFARELGLDMAKFEKDLDDPATLDRVVKDRTDGTALGVRGTPTFFINGTQFTGRPSYDGLKAAIDQALGQ
ncbi:protein-disulfide isomerase [Lentzea atacamensis]|uniref:Protein-disulfide isomerase n=1 Tax=Lentzea atacamensis TaxID=531938 RepID=A0A316I4A3_9PSEU|nr:thioredoxin domain-containing protein [Lentzea atacamensis]PWK82158.1 protein-disulfide isomerase [Lentzea atacamensis]